MSESDGKERKVDRRERSVVANIPPSGTLVIAQELVPQMGSSGKFLARMEIDMRKFAILSLSDQVALGQFLFLAEMYDDPFFAFMVEWILNTSPSIEGKGREQVIDTIAASVSGQRRQDYVTKPNWIGRHITKRDYRKDAERKGQTIID